MTETNNVTSWTRIWRIARAALIGYFLVLLMMRVFENQLVYPAPTASHRWREAATIGAEEVHFQAEDGVELHGWYTAGEQPRGYLLYCHGNGENVSDQAELMALLRDEYNLAVFVFDYRGYGKSKGSPEETGVLADGEAAYLWLCERAKRDGEPSPKVVLMGRSLGGGVVVDLASRHASCALVLESTFSSMPDAAARLFWWAPVRWLMRNRYDSISKIRHYEGPLLQTHSRHDDLIAYDLAQALFDACPSADKQFVTASQGNHNTPPPVEYYQQLALLLQRVLPDGPPAAQ